MKLPQVNKWTSKQINEENRQRLSKKKIKVDQGRLRLKSMFAPFAIECWFVLFIFKQKFKNIDIFDNGLTIWLYYSTNYTNSVPFQK